MREEHLVEKKVEKTVNVSEKDKTKQNKRDSEGENRKMRGKNSKQININMSCDRTHTLIMDIKSVFTASNSNTTLYGCQRN